jgi:Septum formation
LPSHARGDCLTWDQSGAATETRAASAVPCDQPHLLEVAGTTVVPSQVDHYLSAAEWGALLTTECRSITQDLFGGEFDPYGRYRPSGVYPSRHSWPLGDRQLLCGVASNIIPTEPTEGSEGELTGTARASDQHYVRPPGVCGSAATGGQLDCAASHEYEISGAIDLSGKTLAVPAASDPSWALLAGPGCEAVARTYLGRPLRPGERSIYFFIDPKSWELGQHQAECGVERADGDTPVPMT